VHHFLPLSIWVEVCISDFTGILLDGFIGGLNPSIEKGYKKVSRI